MSADDARLLHLDGVEPEDITGLSDYECYARLSLDGRRLPLFSLRVAPATPPDEQQQRRVRERGEQRSGRRPVEDVDALLQESQVRRATMKPQQKKRRKAGEYDGYEYEAVRDPGQGPDEEQKKSRGERKRGSGRNTEEPEVKKGSETHSTRPRGTRCMNPMVPPQRQAKRREARYQEKQEERGHDGA